MRKYLFIVFSALLILSACGGSNDKKVVNELEEETDDKSEESNGDEIDRNNENGEVMKLGETGYVDDGIFQYEITPLSFEIFEERNGTSVNNDDEVFVLIDYTIKSLSEEGFEEEEMLIGGDLLLKNSQGNIASEITYYDYDFVDKIAETIEPEKSYDSQMLFEVPKSETSEYTLHFGSYSSDINDAEWSFEESEAK
ncbi:MAG TPA: hypothetical protein H9895_00855 [Candidatus Pseudogracilibacillus intestinigallinarum]|uniref:DUF4352 domain-containing protein n=1 Tax=Candidatus Pseudogracilibacillus intestinigallinarum TaxID=2838742 RepID=A0A9D1PKA7_9BACI|nr:hypothetical protein [Candidatus Pseudogracilibacillus intestinigallinarum]